jgi:hypothetical protein
MLLLLAIPEERRYILLMLYKTKVALCYEIQTKHINEHIVEFLNVKPGGK